MCWWKSKPWPLLSHSSASRLSVHFCQLLLIPSICATIALTPLQTRAEAVYLSICASMTDAVRELTENFTALHPGIGIFPNIGPSGSLAKQIEQGAPADLFVSANPDWMKYLEEKKLVDLSSTTALARNSLVFVGPADTGPYGPGDLPRLERIAMGNPASVPAGQYAREALENLGLFADLHRNRTLVMAKDVRQALLYADRGEVDGAFVYRSDALLSRRTVVHFEIDPSLHAPIIYPLALTAAGKEKVEARMFFDYLTSSEAESVIRRHGFDPPP